MYVWHTVVVDVQASYDNLVQIDTLIERNYPGVRSGEEVGRQGPVYVIISHTASS